jgi:hypothetical protein
MQPTDFPRVNALLDWLLPALQKTLNDNLGGVYLHGSLVTGDYDDALSDIDLVTVLERDPTEADLDPLHALHTDLVARFPHWQNRIEVAYISRRALDTFKTQASPIGRISSGETLHRVQAGIEWLMNWYRVRENGLTLLGPPPSTLIPPITHAEYVECVRNYLLGWQGYAPAADAHHGSLAYDVLTLCRGLHTLQTGEAVSKIKAAAWAKVTFPAWAGLIDQALVWRSRMHEYRVYADLPVEDVARFVSFVLDQVTTVDSHT